MQANIWVDDVLTDSGWKGSWNMGVTGMYQQACQNEPTTRKMLQKAVIPKANPGNF